MHKVDISYVFCMKLLCAQNGKTSKQILQNNKKTTMSHRIFNKWLPLLCLLWLPAQTVFGQLWPVNPSGYQFSMNVVAQMQVGGQPNHTPGNTIAAFHQGAVRGAANPLVINDKAYYFLTLYSNSYIGDSLGFRAFLLVGNQLYESSDTIVFAHQKVLGDLANPFPINFGPSEKPFIHSAGDVDFTELSCPDTLHDVQASDDVSSEGAGLVYSLTGGADVSKFSIDPQTGLLSWLNFDPDFENPSDMNGDNLYEVQVTVTDASGYTDVQWITVRVLDNPPPLAQCPDNITVGTGDDDAGNCTAVAIGTKLTGITDTCVNSIVYVLEGATVGNGAGNMAADQLFNLGATTVTYAVTSGESGGSATCSFVVTVTDNEDPVVTCPANDVRYPGGPDCNYTIDGSELDVTAMDNCSLSTLVNSLNNSTTLGGIVLQSNTTTTVTWLATDAAGRTGSCLSVITVDDCNINLSGTIQWKTNPTQGVNTVTVTLSGSESGSMTTGPNGNYLFMTAVPTGSFTVKPTKNINKLNGVSAADVSAIQQHIAGNFPITDLYRLVAADVNKSNSVTTQDVTTLNQALLGNPAALIQIKTSWRFVPTTHVMNNPPWGFPESLVLTNVTGNQFAKDFYGIKTGDVVATFANPANFGPDGGSGLTFTIEDLVLEAGEEVSVDFRAGYFDDLTAFQWALQFDPERLEWLATEPLEGFPLMQEHIGIYNIGAGEIRAVWSQAEGVLVTEGEGVCRIKFRVLQSGGKLSEVLALDESEIPASAYTSVFGESKVVLKFGELSGAGDPAGAGGVQLLQNRPNPFSKMTTIGFLLPVQTNAQLRVYDLNGRLIQTVENNYPAGYNEEKLHLEGASGLLFYELITPFSVLTKRMMAAK